MGLVVLSSNAQFLQLELEPWQGQTPDVPYLEERCHYTFRWWYEYSGGQMTDWGAHHVDIAQWAIHSNPVEIDGRGRFGNGVDSYNVPLDFTVDYLFENGVRMTVRDEGENGILYGGPGKNLCEPR